jgi:hypothetical protein
VSAPTKEEIVAVAERELGVRLPREYRARLVAANGGALATGGSAWKVFPVRDPARPAASPGGDLVSATHRARAEAGFPADAVAIASNGDGDLLVLVQSASGNRLEAQVHRWSHETRRCKPVPLRYDD